MIQERISIDKLEQKIAEKASWKKILTDLDKN
jgi:hypothetical protein